MDLSEFDEDDLVALRIAVEAELQSRGISFSVGAIGERLAIDHFNNTPGLSNLLAAPPGAKNVDALSRNGDRYTIKTVLRAKKTGTVYPDPQDPDKQLFEYLLLVRLQPNYTLQSIFRFTWEQFVQSRAWDKRMGAWYIPVSAKRLDGVECLYSADRPST